MKATGIVRRMDELGRIVFPMELRRSLGIKPGDSLEIFVDGEGIFLRKFDVGENLIETIARLESDATSFYNEGNRNEVLACITKLKKAVKE